MQIITVAVIKGGTGKTATCAAIAQAAAVEGKKVLCVDLDPQANLTATLGADRTAPGAYNLLQGAPILETIQQTAQHIDVIAGAPALAADRPKQVNSIYRLSSALELIQKAYDLIVIDTPPSICQLTYEALQAATGLLVAICADADSLNGMQLILELAKQIKHTNKKLKPLGCIITQYDKRPKIARYMRDMIAEQGNELKCPLLGEVRQGVAIQEARALRRNLYEYAPKSKPAQDYKAIYNKIIK